MFASFQIILLWSAAATFASAADQCAGESKSIVIDHKDQEFQINLNGFEAWEIIFSENATQAVLEYTVTGVTVNSSSTNNSITIESRANDSSSCTDSLECLSSFCDTVSKKCKKEPLNAVSMLCTTNTKVNNVNSSATSSSSKLISPLFLILCLSSLAFELLFPKSRSTTLLLMLFLVLFQVTIAAQTRCASYKLTLPIAMKDKVRTETTPSGVTLTLNSKEDFGICGVKMNALQPYLDPPGDVQRLLSFTFGIQIGISKLNSEALSKACQTLSPIVKGDNLTYAFIDINGVGDSLAKKMLDRAAANDMKKKRKAKGGQESKSVATRFSGFMNESVLPVLPICMAIRPCNQFDKNFGVDFTFGLYSDPGIVIIPATPATAGFELIFNGLAFSTNGELSPFPFSVALFENYAPTRMHMWIKGGITFPIKGKGDATVITVAATGEFGVFGQLNGITSVTFYLSKIMDCGGASVGKLVEALASEVTNPKSAKFQLFSNIEATITLNLKELCGIDNFELKYSLSSMFEFAFDAENNDNTYVDFRMSRKWLLDLSQLLKPMSKVIGKFGEMIASAFELKIETVEQYKLRVAKSLKIGFGVLFSAEVTFGGCEIVTGLINAFIDAVKQASYIVGAQDLIDSVVNPIKKAMESICKGPARFAVSLSFKDSQYDAENTYIEAPGGVKLSLSMLPTCPPPVAPDGKCSKNTDCNGPAYPNGGYCLNNPKWKSSIGCIGKCVHKLVEGSDCSKSSLNIPLVQSIDFTNAEHEACQSGKCFCGKCSASSGVPTGSPCSANSDCASGYCLNDANLKTSIGCMGRCIAKRAQGEDCSKGTLNLPAVQSIDFTSAEHQVCQSGKCYCGRCTGPNGHSGGYACSANSDCASRNCKGDAWKLGITAGCLGKCS